VKYIRNRYQESTRNVWRTINSYDQKMIENRAGTHGPGPDPKYVHRRVRFQNSLLTRPLNDNHDTVTIFSYFA